MSEPHAVVFDVGHVLYDWQPRKLYEGLLPPRDLDQFMDEAVDFAWHAQHDAGRDFADTSAELTARYPQHADLIAMWRPRFNETLSPIAGMREIVEALDVARVPLFAITNFSHQFWPPFRAREEALFGRFRDIVVSGVEKLVKPDPAIFALALARFGLAPGEALFVDDRADNVAAGEAAGLIGHVFHDAPTLRAELVGQGLLARTQEGVNTVSTASGRSSGKSSV